MMSILCPFIVELQFCCYSKNRNNASQKVKFGPFEGMAKERFPHVHILIWLYNKISTYQIDNVICAEITRTYVDKDLHAVIIRNMIHEPCGSLNPN